MPVRQSYLKKICGEIMDKYSDKITTDFDTNKFLVEKLTDIHSKKMRNRIAGFLVNLKRNEDRIITPPYKGKQDRRRGRRR